MAVLGVSAEEFYKLLPVFSQCLKEYRIKLRPNRKRAVGGGRKGDLPENEDKLLYILLYMKLYPTYDALAVLTNHYRSKCGDSVQLLLPVLEATLDRNLALPKRPRGNSLEEIFKQHPEIKDIFIDGTERKVQKPTNLKKRNKLYSGKRKATTRKIVIISDEKKYVHYMSKTKSGRRHDKRIADKENIFGGIPPDVTAWTDTGFQGAQKQHDNTVMPIKATKNHSLTAEQKQHNQIISSIRVVSEHAIGGFKRFKAATDIYRNKLANFDDLLTEVSIGLNNFHLLQTA
ncbi:MAG: transposase family protein [Bryobacteraceae bacterium]|nr:transposase family protein [Bryobacteraceae bacterium]